MEYSSIYTYRIPSCPYPLAPKTAKTLVFIPSPHLIVAHTVRIASATATPFELATSCKKQLLAILTSCGNDVGAANSSGLLLVLQAASVNVFRAPPEAAYLEGGISAVHNLSGHLVLYTVNKDKTKRGVSWGEARGAVLPNFPIFPRARSRCQAKASDRRPSSPHTSSTGHGLPRPPSTTTPPIVSPPSVSVLSLSGTIRTKLISITPGINPRLYRRYAQRHGLELGEVPEELRRR